MSSMKAAVGRQGREVPLEPIRRDGLSMARFGRGASKPAVAAADDGVFTHDASDPLVVDHEALVPRLGGDARGTMAAAVAPMDRWNVAPQLGVVAPTWT